MQFVVAALYHFFDFAHFEQLRAPMLAELKRLQIKGSLLIAPEGINGTVAGARESVDALRKYLENEVIGGAFEVKESVCDTQPFARAKVRLKKETISLGEPVALHKVGRYVGAQAWNEFIADPDTILIDARNDYEVHLGTFEGATNPKTRNFKELPRFVRENLGSAKRKKIATFCTGGIRCEKFTAWLSQEGYEDVYHLKGGILNYLEEVPEAQSKWQGQCYVFDKRIAVGHGLVPSTATTMCYNCGHPLTAADREHGYCIYCQQEPYVSTS